MQNINPTQNRNRRALFYLWMVGIPLFIVGLVSCVWTGLLSQFPLFGNASSVAMGCFGLLGLAAIIGGVVGVYRGLTLARDNELALAVGEYLRQYLNPNYTYIRNVSRRKLGYIDAVLIGTAGALVFRIVDYQGVWRNEMAEWKTRDAKGRVKAAPSNPSRECARDVYALRKFFAQRGLDKIPVYGIVVFHSSQITLQGEGSVVPIAETRLLHPILTREGGFLEDDNRIPIEMVHRAVKALTEG